MRFYILFILLEGDVFGFWVFQRMSLFFEMGNGCKVREREREEESLFIDYFVDK